MVKAAQRTKLSRMRDQRRALLKSLAESLIIHESIVTTAPKAKALRPYIEKLVTRARDDNQHNRRQAKKHLSTTESLNKLFSDIGPRYVKRPGGYTRIERAGWRRGDDAEMARISFVTEKEATAEKSEDSQPKPAPAKSNATKSDSKQSKTTAKKPAENSNKTTKTESKS